MKNHNYCIYHNMGRADEVVDQLLSAGIGPSHISILTTKATGARNLKVPQRRKASVAESAGASVGGAVGLLYCTLITAATCGVGVIAAGPLLTCLIGSSAGGSAGTLAGILSAAGIPEAEARFYAQEICDKDAILIGVEVTDSDGDMVHHIMTRRPVGISACA